MSGRPAGIGRVTPAFQMLRAYSPRRPCLRGFFEAARPAPQVVRLRGFCLKGVFSLRATFDPHGEAFLN